MSDREELDALRRLAELEAKASGSVASKPVVTGSSDPSLFGLKLYGPKAGAEMALNLGSSALGRFAGLVGAGATAIGGGGVDSSKQALEDIQRSMTYEPRSVGGQEAKKSLADMVQWVGSRPAVKSIGEGIDAVGVASPVAGAAIQSIPDLLGVVGARTPLNAAESAIKKAVTPRIDPQVALLGKKAIDAGIPIRPDMLMESKALRGMGSFFEDVPGAGSMKIPRDMEVTKNIVKAINPEETAVKLTSEVYKNALNRSGSGISEIAARNPLQDAKVVNNQLKSVVTSASDYGADVERLVGARARDFKNLISDGVVDGAAFKKWNSKILEDIRSAGDTSSAAQLSKLQNTAMDAFEASMDVGDLPAWKAYRREYATAKQLMPTVAESPTIGVVTPQSLAKSFGTKLSKDRIASGAAGDTGDIYDITKQFMREPTLSNLAERKLAYAGLGAAGAGIGIATGPALPLAVGGGLYGLANIYNRFGPKVARAMIEKSLPKSSIQSTPSSAIPGLMVNELNMSPSQMRGLFGNITE